MKYTVSVEVTTTYSVDVEADSAEDAEDKALNMEFGDMTEIGETVEVFAIEEKHV